MEFGVLGALEVHVHTRAMSLGSLKQRVLLGVLLHRANTVVSADALIEAVWGDQPPRTAVKNLQVYVWHLRRVLAADDETGRLTYRAPGYRLAVRPGELDRDRFDAHARQGRQALAEHRPRVAARHFEAALALWRDRPYADLHGADALRSAAERMEEHRLAVLEDRAEAGLAAGDPAAALLEHLDPLVREHPLRERLRALQMLALHRAGRPAEALSAYDDIRRRLAGELGIAPSPVLARLQRAVLDGEAVGAEALWPGAPTAHASGPPAAPAASGACPESCQLPRDLPDLVGRLRETDDAVRALTPACEQGAGGPARPGPSVFEALTGLRFEPPRPRSTLAVLSGPVGGGKTVLAVRVAHLLRPHFPDGQLWVSLRTPDGRARPAADALEELCRALGATDGPDGGDGPGDGTGPRPPGAARGSLARLVARYRTACADRRLLVVLDDAVDEAQVRPLLPGGDGCATLVTSRLLLGALESAHRTEVGCFAPEESAELLARVAGAERTAAEAAACAEAARLVGHLPLGVRLVGARLAAQPHWTVGRLVARLADPARGLGELTVGDVSVRRSFDLAAAALTGPELRAYRHLGTLPRDRVVGRPVTPELLDLPSSDAEDVLEGLTAQRFAEAGPEGYTLHPLHHLHAASLPRPTSLTLPVPAVPAATPATPGTPPRTPLHP
ncbi:BTAD domain-containing putative transcriptional regulator [Streptomyces sp. TRM 70351]|uniref:AfsR/SARP family transcriptional regulator n=1 Tax=Streptomyces sp. TRM 70351 TaxID=3116552 RepID=UPI002E7B38A1|nr:BTAD domain-containing putative transcriptional regulator [Streptomyces sp. TRM 70351]MEE1928280.1 BTAD domain-containing putative transcriptional regulator [Streptomyces sp. TRM 70351]